MLLEYIERINQRYQSATATEHTFRGDLQQLIESVAPEISATNEPKRQSCGAPDYILTKADIPVGFIETKNIGNNDLAGKGRNKEQFDRYKTSLGNLIFTDYINFHFYNDGKFITEIAIAEVREESIIAIPQNFAEFENLLKDFCTARGQPIKSPQKLAEMMAGKARLLADVIEKSLTSDDDNEEDSTLKQQMMAFKDILIHDITEKRFADVYAQTIAYGMFAARLHDPDLDTFSRQQAAELIPRSNPFLRKLFGYIAGPEIDDRIQWIVDNLADIFLACNVEQILKNYGKTTKMEDPIIHFYETFLEQYDRSLKIERGNWYTPVPIVNFIVRSVDEILKTEFGLKDGLADTSKTNIKLTAGQNSKKGYQQQVHKVQILDPATGTGTFLAEVVKQIHKKFKAQQGIWSGYVENDLLPRLYGFELLMASYAIAHSQLDLLLKQTGFKPTKNRRTRVYLTNSLEPHHPDTGTLFATWLSDEANEANHIKRDTPVMCVIGNPPYKSESANKGKWIMKLMEDYKKEPGGKEKLKEKNSKAINDDYSKFLRYGQHYIEKNGSGVLAFINPHGFLENTTFRGMRWHLLKTYDKIYTIDLHGNSNKKEVSPDGSVDQNVFDIQQGVAITVFVKIGKKKKNDLGQVFHCDLFGKRDSKYDFLMQNSINTIKYKKLPNVAPDYFFVPKDNTGQKGYGKGFLLPDLFHISGMGIATGSDEKYISINRDDLEQRFGSNMFIKSISYRLFDKRYIYYDTEKIERGREKLMIHLSGNDNLGLISLKRVRNDLTSKFGIVNDIVDKSIISTLDNGYVFPLYLYPDAQTKQREPNFNQKIVNEIADKLSLTFTSEKQTTKNTFAPIDILDYIYAVLHSPTYRKKYKEFLKIDFPRVPYPKHQRTFWQLVKAGGKIRQLHLLESPQVEKYSTRYPEHGSNEITTGITKKDWQLTGKNNQSGRIWINDTQYFDNIPLLAWEFYIVGYQPAQKWLKDRKGTTLEYEDIIHYQKIIAALVATDRLMQEIDALEIEQ